MSMLKDALVRASGNAFVQRLLEKNVSVSQFLMGVGSGGGVESSGERVVLERLGKRSPPYCIFDVGANRGQYLEMLLRNLGRDCSVHCFEPSTSSFASLQRLPLDSGRVRLNHLALGKERGETELHFDEPGSVLASLSKRRLDHFGLAFSQSETVRVETIDHYCAENSVDRISLLKLDVEGHEMDVLEGATGMFEREAIELVAFEFGGCNIDSRSFFQDFYYFFAARGMQLHRITPSGYLCPLPAYKETLEQFRTTNFVALRRD